MVNGEVDGGGISEAPRWRVAGSVGMKSRSVGGWGRTEQSREWISVVKGAAGGLRGYTDRIVHLTSVFGYALL
jgi:hypothetical protein